MTYDSTACGSSRVNFFRESPGNFKRDSFDEFDRVSFDRSLNLLFASGKATFVDPALGPVVLTRKTTARRFIARRHDDRVDLTIPAFVTSREEIIRIFLRFRARLQKDVTASPGVRFFDGQEIAVPGFTFHIGRQSLVPKGINVEANLTRASLAVGTELDFNSEHVTANLDKAIKNVAKRLVPILLFPRVRELADKWGLHPSNLLVGRGLRTFGTCNNRGEIRLSLSVVFLDEELRDYIILHELAHLSHFDHSPEFHRLLNLYTDGQEERLVNRLHHFHWPIRR